MLLLLCTLISESFGSVQKFFSYFSFFSYLFHLEKIPRHIPAKKTHCVLSALLHFSDVLGGEVFLLYFPRDVQCRSEDGEKWWK